MRVRGEAFAGGLGARLPSSPRPSLSLRLFLRSTLSGASLLVAKMGRQRSRRVRTRPQRPRSTAPSRCLGPSPCWPDGFLGRRPSRHLAFRSSRFLLPAWPSELEAECSLRTYSSSMRFVSALGGTSGVSCCFLRVSARAERRCCAFRAARSAMARRVNAAPLLRHLGLAATPTTCLGLAPEPFPAPTPGPPATTSKARPK